MRSALWAGYSEEADGALPLCTTTWGDDKLSCEQPSPAVGAGRLPLTAGMARADTRMLMAACHFGHLPRVSLLLLNGAPLEQQDRTESSPRLCRSGNCRGGLRTVSPKRQVTPPRMARGEE
jgi:hypothetical protein